MSTPCLPTGALALLQEEIELSLPEQAALRARIYRQPTSSMAAAPANALVLHFHGGAFVRGDLDDGRAAAQLHAQAGAVVLSIAYPLAPEHPFPAPVMLGHAALVWLSAQRGVLAAGDAGLFLAGEEAGANLAAAVAMLARDRGEPPVAGQVLLSPMLDPCAGTRSLRDSTPGAQRCPWASGWRDYLARPTDAMHPYAVPAASMRLNGLPPALILLGEGDPMGDEAKGFAARLLQAGVAAQVHTVPGVANWPMALCTRDAPACAGAALARGLLQSFYQKDRAVSLA